MTFKLVMVTAVSGETDIYDYDVTVRNWCRSQCSCSCIFCTCITSICWYLGTCCRWLHSSSELFVYWYSWIGSICQPECRLTSNRVSEPFLINDVINLLATHTNRFAEQFISICRLKQKARAHRWHATDVVEMRKFLGLLLLMGIIQKPRVQKKTYACGTVRHNLRTCWKLSFPASWIKRKPLLRRMAMSWRWSSKTNEKFWRCQPYMLDTLLKAQKETGMVSQSRNLTVFAYNTHMRGSIV